MVNEMTATPMTSSPRRRCLAIVLAAGEGTRMKSDRPKVLHAIGGLSLLGHVLAATRASGAADAVAVVVGPGHDAVAAEARARAPGCSVFVQEQRLGTAHAVLSAAPALEQGFDEILIVFGDTPLVRPETLAGLRAAIAAGAAVAALGFEAADPTSYGRMLVRDGMLEAIREHKDATAAEREVTLCNAGLMALAGPTALDLLASVSSDNAAGEFYLTDVVALARSRGLRTVALTAPEDEVMGINDRTQLAAAEAILQGRLRLAAMRSGVTLVAPQTVHFSHDTVLGRDTIVEPNVVFGPKVTVGARVAIHAFSHLEGTSVADGVSVGPFARLRPGARLAAGSRVGNFVEIKNADVGPGAKVNHLSYIGDASIGAAANIGAGAITCNYDGFAKHETIIGERAFIGSNAALVAPVTVGAGAFVGSGSVVTEDVPADALALARNRQVVKPGWATYFRAKAAALKAARDADRSD
jgi:bifunctional UDP-N-acetylglucosamine pyrophosphorylase/glucosamine-1-phosphate N-acetyltransferase